MARYIYCILLGVFFILGFNSFFNKDTQAFRVKTGTATNIQSRSELIAAQQSFEESETINKEGYSCKTNNGILGSTFSPRTISPSKILRLSPTSIAIQILSAINTQLPDKILTGPSLYINPTKQSYRYYIYTLKRILI